MKSNNDKTTGYWLAGSKENLAKAKRDFEMGDNVYGLFWLHLATEKLLKAHHVKNKNRPAPYTHELAYLAKQAGFLSVMRVN